MRIALLPTGQTEWRGLAEALGRLFPEHEFYCLPSDAEIRTQRGTAGRCPSQYLKQHHRADRLRPAQSTARALYGENPQPPRSSGGGSKGGGATAMRGSLSSSSPSLQWIRRNTTGSLTERPPSLLTD